MWGNQTAHGSASTDLAPAFSRIPLLELPRSVPSRVRVRTCSMRCAPQFLVLSDCGPPAIERGLGSRARRQASAADDNRSMGKGRPMNCVHCGDPLPGPWHMSQEDRLPELRVGSLVVAKKASGGLRPGRARRCL